MTYRSNISNRKGRFINKNNDRSSKWCGECFPDRERVCATLRIRSLIQLAHHLRISQIPENAVMCHLGVQRCGISYVLPVRFVPDISQQFPAHMCEFGEFMMFIASCGTPVHPIKNHPQYESRNGLVSTFGLVNTTFCLPKPTGPVPPHKAFEELGWNRTSTTSHEWKLLLKGLKRSVLSVA